MGGFNSGRRPGRACTEDYLRLDVRRLHRDGLLSKRYPFVWEWMCNGEAYAKVRIEPEAGRVWLEYHHTSSGGSSRSLRYPVNLAWSACPLGGQRPWFVCPALGCGRRVAILYAGEVFACRHCYRLAYPSQREPAYDRAARRAERIRDRLEWEPGILDGGGLKPKWMRWKTYRRLVDMHDRLVRSSLAGAAVRFKTEFDF